MNLQQAIIEVEYAHYWGIYADYPFSPTSEARYGPVEFENGGLLDDKVFFCDGIRAGDFFLAQADGDSMMLEIDDWCEECATLLIDQENDDLATREESLPLLARLYKMDYSGLRRQASEGNLDARQSGKTWLSSRRAVEKYLASDGRRKENRKEPDQ